jgi:hypothetical protein
MDKSYTLDLSDDQVKFITEQQKKRLAEKHVYLSPGAMEIFLIAIAAIVKEPSRNWPSGFRSDEQILQETQTRFIDAFAYNMLALTYKNNNREIGVFDAIEAIATNSWVTCCMIKAYSAT